jgi:hypothetical protein
MGSVSGRVRGHGIPLLPRVRLWTWTEQRMARRYRTRSRAQIVVLGHEAIGCSVADISATGARVLVDPAASVPDSFILKLRVARKWSAAQSQYRKATYPGKQAPHHAATSVSLKAVLKTMNRRSMGPLPWRSEDGQHSTECLMDSLSL